eukprot:CAMPEP_0202463578 /NCGR_PEP_ID=MMETSP1360-20130828/58741_1 /ASSEMBLY_ACC=CAM_ASM_000848 /TAXON_ID=515479 /ORGANISM="Licmophora paradoxa, Strain CCMP2313" /LENGTH=49 /DNA_ID=CAMNT_0049086539 /DNA_START=69 /DNA_END=218 /DNA_ORIENTATION=-
MRLSIPAKGLVGADDIAIAVTALLLGLLGALGLALSPLFLRNDFRFMTS